MADGECNGNGSCAVASPLYDHNPHPTTEARQNGGVGGPILIDDQHPRGTAITRFNAKLAVLVTELVGTMWCAYAFALFDLLALPNSLKAGLYGVVQWVASFFLQLVLLSIIMVGQEVQAEAADKRAIQTYEDADATLHETIEIQKHLAAQDHILDDLIGKLQEVERKLADDVRRLT